MVFGGRKPRIAGRRMITADDATRSGALRSSSPPGPDPRDSEESSFPGRTRGGAARTNLNDITRRAPGQARARRASLGGRSASVTSTSWAGSGEPFASTPYSAKMAWRAPRYVANNGVLRLCASRRLLPRAGEPAFRGPLVTASSHSLRVSREPPVFPGFFEWRDQLPRGAIATLVSKTLHLEEFQSALCS